MTDGPYLPTHSAVGGVCDPAIEASASQGPATEARKGHDTIQEIEGLSATDCASTSAWSIPSHAGRLVWIDMSPTRGARSGVGGSSPLRSRCTSGEQRSA